MSLRPVLKALQQDVIKRKHSHLSIGDAKDLGRGLLQTHFISSTFISSTASKNARTQDHNEPPSMPLIRDTCARFSAAGICSSWRYAAAPSPRSCPVPANGQAHQTGVRARRLPSSRFVTGRLCCEPRPAVDHHRDTTASRAHTFVTVWLVPAPSRSVPL